MKAKKDKIWKGFDLSRKSRILSSERLDTGPDTILLIIEQVDYSFDDE
jgi:hypothetical protein